MVSLGIHSSSVIITWTVRQTKVCRRVLLETNRKPRFVGYLSWEEERNG